MTDLIADRAPLDLTKILAAVTPATLTGAGASERAGLDPPVAESRVVLDAVLQLVSEVHPSDVLRRIVRTACMLVDARHGALAVIGPQRSVVQLVPKSRDGDVAMTFGDLEGDDLAQLLGDEPIRCANLGTHLASRGIPRGSSTIGAFLGIPIRSRRGFSGTIGLTEKRDGRDFTDGDMKLIVSFAAVAGAVIDNAQLSHEARQRELWVALHGEIATALLAGVEIDKVLDLIARGARELTDADASTICLLDGSSQMTVRAADGRRAELLLGMGLPIESSISGEVVRTGEPAILTDDYSEVSANEPILTVGEVGPAMFVPLVSEGRANGVLAVARLATSRALDPTDFWLLESFASQVSVALEYGRARAELERLALLDDQERIARDLHDNVIQQLFAAGMSLQAIAKRMTEPVLAERVLQAVGTLDTTIRDIRATVFALALPTEGRGGVRTSVLAVASELSEQHHFKVRVDFDGPIDAAVGPNIQPHVMATVREALSNVARHARATQVDLSVEVGSDIVVRICDDGIGIPATETRRSGLHNLAERALALGGSMEIATPPSGGTELVWRVPITG